MLRPSLGLNFISLQDRRFSSGVHQQQIWTPAAVSLPPGSLPVGLWKVMAFFVKEKFTVNLPANVTCATSILRKNSTKKVGRDILDFLLSTCMGVCQGLRAAEHHVYYYYVAIPAIPRTVRACMRRVYRIYTVHPYAIIIMR